MPTRPPALFIGHGSPLNALADTPASRAWSGLGRRLPHPAAVLCLSAHWETEGWRVTAMPRPRTIHDFRGFPDELRAFTYPAPGSPELAARVCALLGGMDCRPTEEWGLDHGAWSVLARLLPAADVPVAQLSLSRRASLPGFLELGRRLRPLRDEGVLLLGSGNVVHNLGRLDWDDAEGRRPAAWAVEFDRWVAGRLVEGGEVELARPESHPAWPLAAPTREHYLPLLAVAGSAVPGEERESFLGSIELGSLSMRCLRLGAFPVA